VDLDISDILDAWPFEPGQLNVRLVEGRDGEARVQIRLDLGLLQLCVDGRPDGQRPEGFDSLLELHEARLDAAEALAPDEDADTDTDEEGLLPEQPPPAPRRRGGRDSGGSAPADAPTGGGADATGDGPGGPPEDEREGGADAGLDGDAGDGSDGGSGRATSLSLTAEDCRLLRDEAMQYYHRSVALLALEDFEAVVRDATRNLRAMDLLAARGPTPEDRLAMEPHRGHTLALRSRALASLALKDGENKAALLALDRGLEDLRAWHARVGDADGFERSKEAEMLRAMRDALVPKLPISQKAELKRRLEAAIAAENYELAAILRDELKLLPDEPRKPGV
jgi:hypothetical protein